MTMLGKILIWLGIKEPPRKRRKVSFYKGPRKRVRRTGKLPFPKGWA